MSPTTRRILEEYQSMHSLYQDLCIVVHNTLYGMLEKGKYKYHINKRVKDINSLTEKIERKAALGTHYRHIEDIKDIVGIRIVFYTETERKRFLKNLQKEFGKAIIVKETKGNHGYASIHAIASLQNKKYKLDEYKRFIGLQCEIQLSLILNHAWAEIEHDILYKAGPKVKQINPTEYNNLRERMERIMSEYIKMASYELENIVDEIRHIRIRKK